MIKLKSIFIKENDEDNILRSFNKSRFTIAIELVFITYPIMKPYLKHSIFMSKTPQSSSKYKCNLYPNSLI